MAEFNVTCCDSTVSVWQRPPELAGPKAAHVQVGRPGVVVHEEISKGEVTATFSLLELASKQNSSFELAKWMQLQINLLKKGMVVSAHLKNLDKGESFDQSSKNGLSPIVNACLTSIKDGVDAVKKLQQYEKEKFTPEEPQ